MTEPMTKDEYADLLEGLHAGAPSPDLETFQRAEMYDPNFSWRIPDGHFHNLFDAAMERIEELETRLKNLLGSDLGEG